MAPISEFLTDSETFARRGSHDVLPIHVGNIWQCGPGDTGLPAHKGTFRTGAESDRGVLCISFESEDTNMNIRAKSIVTTLALTLIATAPAWSQSLLKRLDPDNDGTIDLAEAKSAASKVFDKLDRDHDGTLDKRELRGRVNAKDFAAADPDNDGTLDKNEFLALVEKRFKVANPDNDGTVDAKELKSAAGRSLARLLN
jgi:hypothetical protein